jgi:hypothetical protein
MPPGLEHENWKRPFKKYSYRNFQASRKYSKQENKKPLPVGMVIIPKPLPVGLVVQNTQPFPDNTQQKEHLVEKTSVLTKVHEVFVVEEIPEECYYCGNDGVHLSQVNRPDNTPTKCCDYCWCKHKFVYLELGYVRVL